MVKPAGSQTPHNTKKAMKVKKSHRRNIPQNSTHRHIANMATMTIVLPSTRHIPQHTLRKFSTAPSGHNSPSSTKKPSIDFAGIDDMLKEMEMDDLTRQEEKALQAADPIGYHLRKMTDENPALAQLLGEAENSPMKYSLDRKADTRLKQKDLLEKYEGDINSLLSQRNDEEEAAIDRMLYDDSTDNFYEQTLRSHHHALIEKQHRLQQHRVLNMNEFVRPAEFNDINTNFPNLALNNVYGKDHKKKQQLIEEYENKIEQMRQFDEQIRIQKEQQEKIQQMYQEQEERRLRAGPHDDFLKAHGLGFDFDTPSLESIKTYEIKKSKKSKITQRTILDDIEDEQNNQQEQQSYQHTVEAKEQLGEDGRNLNDPDHNYDDNELLLDDIDEEELAMSLKNVKIGSSSLGASNLFSKKKNIFPHGENDNEDEDEFADSTGGEDDTDLEELDKIPEELDPDVQDILKRQYRAIPRYSDTPDNNGLDLDSDDNDDSDGDDNASIDKHKNKKSQHNHLQKNKHGQTVAHDYITPEELEMLKNAEDVFSADKGDQQLDDSEKGDENDDPVKDFEFMQKVDEEAVHETIGKIPRAWSLRIKPILAILKQITTRGKLTVSHRNPSKGLDRAARLLLELNARTDLPNIPRSVFAVIVNKCIPPQKMVNGIPVGRAWASPALGPFLLLVMSTAAQNNVRFSDVEWQWVLTGVAQSANPVNFDSIRELLLDAIDLFRNSEIIRGVKKLRHRSSQLRHRFNQSSPLHQRKVIITAPNVRLIEQRAWVEFYNYARSPDIVLPFNRIHDSVVFKPQNFNNNMTNTGFIADHVAEDVLSRDFVDFHRIDEAGEDDHNIHDAIMADDNDDLTNPQSHHTAKNLTDTSKIFPNGTKRRHKYAHYSNRQLNGLIHESDIDNPDPHYISTRFEKATKFWLSPDHNPQLFNYQDDDNVTQHMGYMSTPDDILDEPWLYQPPHFGDKFLPRMSAQYRADNVAFFPSVISVMSHFTSQGSADVVQAEQFYKYILTVFTNTEGYYRTVMKELRTVDQYRTLHGYQPEEDHQMAQGMESPPGEEFRYFAGYPLIDALDYMSWRKRATQTIITMTRFLAKVYRHENKATQIHHLIQFLFEKQKQFPGLVPVPSMMLLQKYFETTMATQDLTQARETVNMMIALRKMVTPSSDPLLEQSLAEVKRQQLKQIKEDHDDGVLIHYKGTNKRMKNNTFVQYSEDIQLLADRIGQASFNSLQRELDVAVIIAQAALYAQTQNFTAIMELIDSLSKTKDVADKRQQTQNDHYYFDDYAKSLKYISPETKTRLFRMIINFMTQSLYSKRAQTKLGHLTAVNANRTIMDTYKRVKQRHEDDLAQKYPQLHQLSPETRAKFEEVQHELFLRKIRSEVQPHLDALLRPTPLVDFDRVFDPKASELTKRLTTLTGLTPGHVIWLFHQAQRNGAAITRKLVHDTLSLLASFPGMIGNYASYTFFNDMIDIGFRISRPTLKLIAKNAKRQAISQKRELQHKYSPNNILKIYKELPDSTITIAQLLDAGRSEIPIVFNRELSFLHPNTVLALSKQKNIPLASNTIADILAYYTATRDWTRAVETFRRAMDVAYFGNYQLVKRICALQNIPLSQITDALPLKQHKIAYHARHTLLTEAVAVGNSRLALDVIHDWEEADGIRLLSHNVEITDTNEYNFAIKAEGKYVGDDAKNLRLFPMDNTTFVTANADERCITLRPTMTGFRFLTFLRLIHRARIGLVGNERDYQAIRAHALELGLPMEESLKQLREKLHITPHVAGKIPDLDALIVEAAAVRGVSVESLINSTKVLEISTTPHSVDKKDEDFEHIHHKKKQQKDTNDIALITQTDVSHEQETDTLHQYQAQTQLNKQIELKKSISTLKLDQQKYLVEIIARIKNNQQHGVSKHLNLRHARTLPRVFDLLLQTNTAENNVYQRRFMERLGMNPNWNMVHTLVQSATSLAFSNNVFKWTKRKNIDSAAVRIARTVANAENTNDLSLAPELNASHPTIGLTTHITTMTNAQLGIKVDYAHDLSEIDRFQKKHGEAVLSIERNLEKLLIKANAQYRATLRTHKNDSNHPDVVATKEFMERISSHQPSVRRLQWYQQQLNDKIEEVVSPQFFADVETHSLSIKLAAQRLLDHYPFENEKDAISTILHSRVGMGDFGLEYETHKIPFLTYGDHNNKNKHHHNSNPRALSFTLQNNQLTYQNKSKMKHGGIILPLSLMLGSPALKLPGLALKKKIAASIEPIDNLEDAQQLSKLFKYKTVTRYNMMIGTEHIDSTLKEIYWRGLSILPINFYEIMNTITQHSTLESHAPQAMLSLIPYFCAFTHNMNIFPILDRSNRGAHLLSTTNIKTYHSLKNVNNHALHSLSADGDDVVNEVEERIIKDIGYTSGENNNDNLKLRTNATMTTIDKINGSLVVYQSQVVNLGMKTLAHGIATQLSTMHDELFRILYPQNHQSLSRSNCRNNNNHSNNGPVKPRLHILQRNTRHIGRDYQVPITINGTLDYIKKFEDHFAAIDILLRKIIPFLPPPVDSIINPGKPRFGHRQQYSGVYDDAKQLDSLFKIQVEALTNTQSRQVLHKDSLQRTHHFGLSIVDESAIRNGFRPVSIKTQLPVQRPVKFHIGVNKGGRKDDENDAAGVDPHAEIPELHPKPSNYTESAVFHTNYQNFHFLTDFLYELPIYQQSIQQEMFSSDFTQRIDSATCPAITSPSSAEVWGGSNTFDFTPRVISNYKQQQFMFMSLLRLNAPALSLQTHVNNWVSMSQHAVDCCALALQQLYRINPTQRTPQTEIDTQEIDEKFDAINSLLSQYVTSQPQFDNNDVHTNPQRVVDDIDTIKAKLLDGVFTVAESAMPTKQQLSWLREHLSEQKHELGRLETCHADLKSQFSTVVDNAKQLYKTMKPIVSEELLAKSSIVHDESLIYSDDFDMIPSELHRKDNNQENDHLINQPVVFDDVEMIFDRYASDVCELNHALFQLRDQPFLAHLKDDYSYNRLSFETATSFLQFNQAQQYISQLQHQLNIFENLLQTYKQFIALAAPLGLEFVTSTYNKHVVLRPSLYNPETTDDHARSYKLWSREALLTLQSIRCAPPGQQLKAAASTGTMINWSSFDIHHYENEINRNRQQRAHRKHFDGVDAVIIEDTELDSEHFAEEDSQHLNLLPEIGQDDGPQDFDNLFATLNKSRSLVKQQKNQKADDDVMI